MLAAAAASSAPKDKLGVNQPAPAFSGRTFDKQDFTLGGLKGRVVVLNYWATWCAPCKAEMPMMDRFYRRHHASGFSMIGVTTEDSAPAFMLKKVDVALAYPLALRFKGSAYERTKSVPTSYVIDRRGVLRHIKVGAFAEDEFDALIMPLLAEKAL
ncbi:MAG TPA: TlpA disulfide reductase family protein [Sphingomonadaceae bacterium]|nr:TlpA disulfide reductase family protein [Sphingomonadaceae bacterium]